MASATIADALLKLNSVAYYCMAAMKTATKTLLALTAAAAFGGFAATSLNLMLEQPARATPPPPAPAPVGGTLPVAVASTPMPSLAPMLKKVLPAVVSVNTKQRVRVNTPFGDDPMFRRMFESYFDRRMELAWPGLS